MSKAPKRNGLASLAGLSVDVLCRQATMYVDGVSVGAYYPYTFDESRISGSEGGTITWGSGSSGGQAHLRWNWGKRATGAFDRLD